MGIDDLYSDSIGKQIIENINQCMQLKEVYERHMTRILGNGEKPHAKITAA
jgi:hypothetical protein